MALSMAKLPTGQKVPILGFGTWLAKGDEFKKALEVALETGYRHIDCAAVYENEAQIGKVLKRWLDSGKITREELFIVSKLPPGGNRPEGVRKWLERTLKDLQLDYVDLYLVHTPFAFQQVEGDMHPKNEKGEILVDHTTDHLAVWAEMENQVKEGRTRAIGLSNFNIRQIQRILKHATVPVSMLQIELHLYFQQKELVEFCKNNEILVTAYSPLGSRGLVKLINKTDTLPDLLTNPTVKEIANNRGKTPAQILLRHIIQKGIIAIPKSTNSDRIRENFNIFDWQLTEEEMISLNNLDQGRHGRINNFTFLSGIENHPEFPFPEELNN